ncbi:hypothetical protein JCM4814A_48240 [Streptomyces phaeofaciens JCM 4814]|uniref:Uncharacterized protein n=1 Tax=Streptomyces phaeofaciens TaxID=68254 RepID=A0A918H345_9ACTN|nr:hypothetical protein [Streptomyces phaeofaciens]GGT31781.1 hypothetical protein GCM10010226_04900 [Streptomyces phaeofaciens]
MRRNSLPARATSRPVVAALAAVGAVAGVLVGWSGLDTVNGCGLATERHPSATAADWVRYADVVVVGKADRERESGREELATGPYSHLLERTVELTTQDTPFISRTRSHPTVGATLDYVAPGWKLLRSDGETRVALLTGDAPRVVPGHTYILALRWEGERWVALGEGAVVPFDDQRIGRGEWCGQILDTDGFAQGERIGRAGDRSLEKTLIGQGVPALKRELDRAAQKAS